MFKAKVSRAVKWIAVLILSITLTSCFDLIEEVNFNSDGSGEFSYELNLGKYKFALDKMIKMDSIGRFKIPSKENISQDLKKLEAELNKIDGVTNAQCLANFDYYIFTIKGNFKNVWALNQAYTTVYNFKRKEKIAFIEAYQYDSKTFSRLEKEPKSNIFTRNPFLKEADFSKGKVMIVTRFKQLVQEVSNSNTLISKNGMAILTKCSASQLLNNPTRINCRVKFK